MDRPAQQLVGRSVSLLTHDAHKQWKVFPALVLEVGGRGYDHTYGPYDGGLLLAYVLPDGGMRVSEFLNLFTRFNLAGHGWFYGPEDLSEEDIAKLKTLGAWPAPVVWRESPLESEGE